MSNGDITQGIGKINLQRVIKKASHASLEFTSLDDIPLTSGALDSSPATLADKGDNVSLSNKFHSYEFSDFISHKSALPSETLQQPARLSRNKRKFILPISHSLHASTTNDSDSINLNSTSIGPVRKSVAFVTNNKLSIGERNLAPSTSTELKTSSIFSERLGKRAFNDIGSSEEPADLKTSDLDSSSGNVNSTMNSHTNEAQKIESTSSSIESQMPPKSPKLERSHSLESLEESASVIEGESLVDQLRRQVEYDKNRITSLYQELEEERNASAIAANQAMAMITKLQEEKAALNMESLQYLRMMEEQAEYDVDELERANDMIAEKEKEIQDLEAELDYFRMKYPDDFPELNDEILLAEEAQASHIESIEFDKL
ncbi:putative myosin-binding protein 4 [Bienertia sinuspersici]